MSDLYAERDIIEQGDHYSRHVSAMTGEGLHSKSAIAAELAHRDIETESLRARVAELEADALRYRFLREQHWSDSSLCVVTTPKESVKPGRLCPSGELLDEAVDQAQCLRQQADDIEKGGEYDR